MWRAPSLHSSIGTLAKYELSRKITISLKKVSDKFSKRLKNDLRDFFPENIFHVVSYYWCLDP
jgi:hypothetical protein